MARMNGSYYVIKVGDEYLTPPSNPCVFSKTQADAWRFSSKDEVPLASGSNERAVKIVRRRRTLASFIAEIEAEAKAAGPEALDQLAAFVTFFRAAREGAK